MLNALRRMLSRRPPETIVSKIQRFTSCRRGAATAELAFTIPILAGLLIGGVEVGQFLVINHKLSRLVDTTNDLVAQSRTISTADLDDIFQSAEYVLQPFELGSSGVLVVSSVTAAPGDSPKVDWQQSGAGSREADSTVGSPGEVANLPEGFTLVDNENVIIGEIFYDYEPFIFQMFVESQTIYYRVLDRPRFGPLGTLQ